MPAEEGELLSGKGGSVRLLLEKAESGGSLGAWIQTVPAGSGPPPHYHEDADEAALMLSGDFEWTLSGEPRRLAPGGFLFVPRGAVHSFVNVGEGEGSFVCWVTPGGFEGYFRERVHLDPVNDREALTEAASRFGMVVVPTDPSRSP
jgi:quercetin dioxygenase-like cupin family protein